MSSDYRFRKTPYSSKKHLSIKRKKNKGLNLKAWRERLQQMASNELLSDVKRENILEEIVLLDKKHGKRLETAAEKDKFDETEPVQTFFNVENVDQFILPDIPLVSETDNTQNELIVSGNVFDKPVQTYPNGENGDQFILPDIPLVSETDNTKNKLITDPFGDDIFTPLDILKIKIEPCEEEIEQKFESQTNTPVTASSCKDFNNTDRNCVCSSPLIDSFSMSSNNVRSCFSFADFEILFEVIKYLDDLANKDKFEAAEKYYIFKLRSASRSQQMLARKLINKVLVEAEKGNLNVDVLNKFQENQKLLDSSVELDIQTCLIQNLSSNTFTDGKHSDTNLKVPQRNNLCQSRNQVLDTMKESLRKCLKQDRSVKSYAHQLRSLSAVQYSFADKLISEILSKAVFGCLTPSSAIPLPIIKKKYPHIRKKRKKQKPVTSSCIMSLKSVQSIRPKLSESKNVTSVTVDRSNHSLKEFVLYPNKASRENLENSSLPIQKLSSNLMPTQTSDIILNTTQDSSVHTQNESLLSTSQTMKKNSQIFLNTVQDFSLPTQKPSFIPTPTQTFTLPFPNSINSGTVVPCSNQSNSAVVTNMAHSPNTISMFPPIAPPTQVYFLPMAPPVSSNLNQFYVVKNLENSHLPNQETRFVSTSSHHLPTT